MSEAFIDLIKQRVSWEVNAGVINWYILLSHIWTSMEHKEIGVGENPSIWGVNENTKTEKIVETCIFLLTSTS